MHGNVDWVRSNAYRQCVEEAVHVDLGGRKFEGGRRSDDLEACMSGCVRRPP